MVEKRRSHRSPLDTPVQVKRVGTDEVAHGHARDVSIGGMFVETSNAPFPFGTEVVVHATLPGHNEELAMRAVVRWNRVDGMGLQFGLLGARETHTITEIVRNQAK